ncbi:type VII secretion system-associated protein [Saccharopolyspora erythraea]|uniref:type VII secretion system-associated protein n=1 Tax=Saccharopolyspora erythraea TaxID=1836 RepID=UPI001BA81DF6|nr:type VII secretion system-associated protein [Saccharopolyspora erythraea]QUH01058.1 type VII secretion system-associated protein [Saccharopolyspora erythraea]
MNTQQPNRPVITPAMREQATKQPNTWLYVVDPIFTDPNAEVPPWGFIGGYRVDERGELTEDFSPNPNYRPSPVALRLPAPTNDVERALQLSTTGYAPGQALLAALLDAELILFAQPQGSGLFTMEHESGRRQLQLFTSETYLPANWTTWQRMTGRKLAGLKVTGMDLQINPTSQVKARIPAEDLVKAAAAVPPKAPVVAPAGPAPNGVPPTANGAALPAATGVPKTAEPDPAETDFGRRFMGSMLAGAIGDALGAAVEFYPVDQIRSRYGAQGVSDYDRGSERAGEFTDDTQMALFTLEGLIRGHIATRSGDADSPLSAVQLAYQRWLHTQGYAWPRAAGPFVDEHPEPNGWLVQQRELFAVRSPNSSCITALREFASVGAPGTFERAINDSQDCGGVVRAAPVALWSQDPREVFELAAATAALTYSRPSGYLPAGVLAVIVHRLLRGEKLPAAVAEARALLVRYRGYRETDRALQAAVDLAASGKPSPEELKDTLGGGWAGHEALAIAVCAALSTDGIAAAVMVAVNHSGDSDSTGAICGNIVGALYGATALPGVWLRDLQHRALVEVLAKDALMEFGPTPPASPGWAQRYPAEKDISELVFTSVLPAAGNEEPEEEPEHAPEPEEEPDDPDRPVIDVPTEKRTVARESAQDRLDPDAAPEARAEADQEDEGATQVVSGDAVAAAGAPAAEPEAPVHAEQVSSVGAEQASAETQQPAEPDVSAEPAEDAEPAETSTPQATPETTPPPEARAEKAEAEQQADAGGAAAETATPQAEPAADVTQRTTVTVSRPGQAPLVAAPAPDREARISGFLLGGAVGDALGYPIEDEPLESIRRKYGPAGLTDFVDAHRPGGSISDDTQMTLFTLDGLIRAGIRRRLYGETEPGTQVQHSYQRWLHTQGFDWREAGGPLAGSAPDGWLIRQKGLFVRRAPGATSIQALHGYATGREQGSFDNLLNDSKSCGGVMRAAPAGLWSQDTAEVFRVGALTAVLTHGHPNGFLPAGALAVIVQQLVLGGSLPVAVDRALTELSTWDGSEETTRVLRLSIELATEGTPTPERIHERLGEGDVGEQALAIAVCAALSHPGSFADAVLLAANHSGDSDSTAAICGNIMGAAQGAAAVPERWLGRLELREVIEQLAQDASREFSANPPTDDEWLQRYPIGPAGEVAPQAPEQAAEAPDAGADEQDAVVAEQSVAEESAAEQPMAEQSVAEGSAAEHSETEPPTIGQPAPEQTADQPTDTGTAPEQAEVVSSGDTAFPTEDQTDAVEEVVEQPADAAAKSNYDANSAVEAGPSETAPAEAPSAGETAEETVGDDTEDDGLSDEELRLLAAWRKFRDGDEDTPSDLSQGLHKLLVEAFGAERAAQLVGEASEEEPTGGALAEETPVQLSTQERFAGCVLGTAAGDALGAPWMFTGLAALLRENPDGVDEFAELFGRRGTATAAAQQSVFLLDGMIRARIRERSRGIADSVPAMVLATLQHWLCAQGARFRPKLPLGELAEAEALRAQRFPDEPSLIALARLEGRGDVPTASRPLNSARSTAATVRGAVLGFHADTPENAVSLGADVAVITHGHPDGYLPAGALAGLVAALDSGRTLADSVQTVLAELDRREGAEVTATGLRSAVELAGSGKVSPVALEELGFGWNAPEALAIAVAAALSHPNSFTDAVSLAATHSGNSAATAAICGSLMGAGRGVRAVPDEWARQLELREVLEPLIDDFGRIEEEIVTDRALPDWAHRYTG